MLWGSPKKKDNDKAPAAASGKESGQAGDGKRPIAGGARRDTQTERKKTATSVPSHIARDELPAFLVNEGQITEAQVARALEIQQETGVFFGEVLVQKGFLEKGTLVGFLAKHCRIPHIGLLDYMLDKSLLHLIPEDICWKYHLLPVDKLANNLTVAMVNPLNYEAIEAVRKCCPGVRVKPVLCSNENFTIVAKRLFGKYKEHDESHWTRVSFQTETEATESRIKASPLKGQPPEAEVVEPEPTPAAPAPQPVTEPARPAVSEKSVLDTDSLMDSVFGKRVASAKDPADESPAAKREPDKDAQSLQSLMQSYTDVMLNSMFDTYELIARKIDFFKGLNPEDVAKIFAQGQVLEYNPAEMLFSEGDPGNDMFVILNGRVKIRSGTKQIAILQSGHIFGEMALVDDAPRSATAVTMTRANLLKISFDDIMNILPPRVATQLLVNIIVTLADRLRKVTKAGM